MWCGCLALSFHFLGIIFSCFRLKSQSKKEVFSMSDAGGAFYFICPSCGEKVKHYDFFSSDSWDECFVWFGTANFRNTFTCPKCRTNFNYANLFQPKSVEMPNETLEIYKEHFCQDDHLSWLINKEMYWDHGCFPDSFLVVERLHQLFPKDLDIAKAFGRVQKTRAFGTQWLTKLEVWSGIVSPDMIVSRSWLKKVFLHDGVTTICASTFKDCARLSDIFLPDTVHSVGKSAFEGSGLLKCHMPNNLDRIEERVFAHCSGLTKLFLPETLKTIEAEAFLGCTSIKSPFFPNSLERIGVRAYYDCYSIHEVTIPASVISIGSEAFGGVYSVTIKGVTGSEAESFAKREGLSFQAIY